MSRAPPVVDPVAPADGESDDGTAVYHGDVLEYRLLGPLEAWIDGRPVDLGGARRRAVLAALLLERGTLVPADRLIERVWGEDPPPTAPTALQGHVSGLRRSLGREAIETRGTGYVLVTDDAAVDADRFAELVDRARPERPARRADLLREALGIWRGSFLADLADEPFVVAVAARHDEARLGALEDRLDADLELGRHAEVAVELAALVGEHPYRERLRAQLMLALYRSGRQAEALEAYRVARETLADELGIDPGPDLQTLEVRILNQDPSLAPPPAPGRRRSNLPVAPSRLVGREQDVEAVGGLLGGDVRLVTLTGPGGTGKTRLAIEVASLVGPDHEDGVWFVDLAPVSEARLVGPAIAAAMELDLPGAEDPAEALVAALRDRRALLVLDNLEHLPEAASLVARIVAAAPAIRVLATSRTPLHVRAEREYPLEPLGPAAAVELFVERAAAVRPGFALSVTEAAVVADLCRAVDGLPLAIELLAPRVRVMAPAAIRERIGGLLEAGRTGPRDLPDRHRTLAATVGWSVDLLSDRARSVFPSLSVFPASFTAEAAAAAAAIDPVAALDLLEELVEASLVGRVDGLGSTTRFALLETIRAFAATRLATAGSTDEVARRHLAYFADLLEEARTTEAPIDGLPWHVALRPEVASIVAALRFAAGSGDATLGLRLGSAGALVLATAGLEAEVGARLEALLAKRPDAALGLRARVSRLAGLARIQHGDRDGIARLDEAIGLARQAQDDVELAAALDARGIAADTFDLADGRGFAEEAVVVAKRSGDTWVEAQATELLARLALSAGDYDAAVQASDRSVELARRHGDPLMITEMLAGLAGALLLAGDADRAEPVIGEAFTLAENHGWDNDLANLRHLRAELHLACGRFRSAIGDLAGCLSRIEATDPDVVANGLLAVADIAIRHEGLFDGARLSGAASSHAVDGILTAHARLHQPALEAARARLGQDAWQGAVEEGRAMSDESVTALVRSVVAAAERADPDTEAPPPRS